MKYYIAKLKKIPRGKRDPSQNGLIRWADSEKGRHALGLDD